MSNGSESIPEYETHCPTCDAPEPTHTATCAVPGRDDFDSMRSRIAALEAVIEKVRTEATEWRKAPHGEVAPVTGAGEFFAALVDSAPPTVLDQMIREAKAEALEVQPSDREELFKLWLRHGSSFESDHSEGYELADALLAAGWRKVADRG